MTKKLSPAQAAHVAGVSRSTISRAIKSLELKAFRNNKNHWLIEEDDVHKWMGEHGQNTVHAHPVAQSRSVDQIHLAKLETENSFLKDQVIDLKADRDAWRKQAERASEPFWRGWFSK